MPSLSSRRFGVFGVFGRRRLAVVSVVLVTAACSSGRVGAPAGSGHIAAQSVPTTPAQLGSRLLTDADLDSAAWHVTDSSESMPNSDPAAPPSSAPSTTASPTFDCSAMVDGLTFLDGAGQPTASASASIDGRAGAVTSTGDIDPPEIQATESLYSYAGSDAHQVMTRVRESVAACPHDMGSSPDMTVTFSLATAPKLGDETLVVRASTSLGILGKSVSDALIVRTGSTILLLEALPTTEHNAGILTSLGPTALKKLS